MGYPSVSNVAEFNHVVQQFQPGHLALIPNVQALQALKDVKERYVCWYNRTGPLAASCTCKGCHKLKRALTTMYHRGSECPQDSLDELAMRVAFEFVCGTLTAAAISGGRWLTCGVRDQGHLDCMKALVIRCGGLRKPCMFAWLAPLASKRQDRNASFFRFARQGACHPQGLTPAAAPPPAARAACWTNLMQGCSGDRIIAAHVHTHTRTHTPLESFGSRSCQDVRVWFSPVQNCPHQCRSWETLLSSSPPQPLR